MKIRDVLEAKGRTVHTVRPDRSAREALVLMNRHRIGCLVVVDGDGNIQGIVSERDILRQVSKSGNGLDNEMVKRLMTARKDTIIATEDDELDYAMRVMTENRIRHLPIAEGKHLTGILSIGDLVKCMLSEIKHENKMLQDYITGRYPG